MGFAMSIVPMKEPMLHAPTFMVARYNRLSPAEQRSLFEHILTRCASASGRPVSVVFDLDGTLLDNRPRTLAIFRELGETWKQKAPSLAERLMHTSVSELMYLAKDSLTKLGVVDPTLMAEGEAFWHARFFRDDYLKHDVALPGAVDFAKACFERGANLVYFTGRDVRNMAVGSFASLRDCGFPIGVSGTSLVLKPTFEMPDEHYKRIYGPALTRAGAVAAVFDNEPGNCNTLLDQHPESLSVFLDTQHLPGAPPLYDRVKVVENFEM